jgi:hypothetical protein
LFSRLTTIPIAEEVPEMTAFLEAGLAVVIARRDKRVDTVEFAPMSERRSAVIVNGQLHFSTYSSVVADIRDYVDKVFSN